MNEHPNATMFRTAAEALNAGDYEKMVDFLDDNVEWWEVGASEPIRGKQALLASFQQGMGKYQISGELHDVLANDDHLVALFNAVGTRAGKTLNYRTAEILHVKDGKITQRWSFADDTQAVQRFFA